MDRRARVGPARWSQVPASPRSTPRPAHSPGRRSTLAVEEQVHLRGRLLARLHHDDRSLLLVHGHSQRPDHLDVRRDAAGQRGDDDRKPRRRSCPFAYSPPLNLAASVITCSDVPQTRPLRGQRTSCLPQLLPVGRRRHVRNEYECRCTGGRHRGSIIRDALLTAETVRHASSGWWVPLGIAPAE